MKKRVVTRDGGMPENIHSRTALPTGTRAEPADPRLQLAVLKAQKPSGKMAQIRGLWPDICEALEAGHSLKHISEHLNQCGLDVSYSLLRRYAARLRRSAATKSSPKHAIAIPTRSSGSQRTGTPAPVSDAVPTGFDPLANLRERLANRPGFQFEERPPDDSKLF